MWEQYIRDLAVFGTNAIELIPPRSDDDADSPHFPLPPIEMMVEMSRIADEYGLDVWIWYPALDKDYADPATVDFAVKEWGEVFKQLPRIDAIFVPGGDPGHTEPRHMFGAARAADREPPPVPPEGDDVGVAAGLHRGLDEPVLRPDGEAAGLARRARLRPAGPGPAADAARERSPSATRSAATPTSPTACARSTRCRTGTSRYAQT